MKKFVIISAAMLVVSVAQADILLKSTVDLSVCKHNGKVVKTGIKQKVQVQSIIQTGSMYAQGSIARLDEQGGYDGDPTEYSCLYFTDFGNHPAKTVAMIGEKTVFSDLSSINLHTLDKADAANANSICNQFPTYPVHATVDMVPTKAGQVVVKGKNYTALINFSATASGRVFQGADSKAFLINKDQGRQALTYTIGRKQIENSDDLLYVECEGSITVQ